MKTIVITSTPDLWQTAQVAGQYTQSTVDSTLDEVGFIHATYPDQTMAMVNGKYAGYDELVLLLVDSDKVTSPIKSEGAKSGRAGTYPHIYGLLDINAVYQAVALTKVDDHFVEPDELVTARRAMVPKASAPAQSVINTVRYVTLATVTPDGQPWNTPLAAYHFPDDATLYWASWQNNQHSQNIRDNGKAFVTIFDSTPADGNPSAGVYMQAEACEITDETEVMKAALVFGEDPWNPSDGKEYLGDKPRRIYKVIPIKIWMNDDSEVDGNFIDVRKEAQT